MKRTFVGNARIFGGWGDALVCYSGDTWLLQRVYGEAIVAISDAMG